MATVNNGSWTLARIRFPDIPKRTPDDMTTARAIHLNGNSHTPKVHFSKRTNNIVDAERYICRILTLNMKGVV